MVSLNKQSVTLDFGGDKLVGVLTMPKEGTNTVALLLHGGPGGTKEGPSNLYVRLAEALAQVGVASARFDFLGEGESGGEYVNTSASHQVEQYQSLVAWLRNRDFERFGVVGESFGGTCALGGYRTDEIQALVLLWPAIWLLDGTFEPIVGEEQKAELREQGYFEIDGLKIGQRFVDELFTESNREAELRQVTAPTLLIHGDADSEVPVHQSQKAFDILNEPKRLIVVPGADHCLRKPDEQALAIQETTDWLKTHLLS